MRGIAVLLLLLLLLLVVPAVADDNEPAPKTKPLTAEQTADAVLAGEVMRVDNRTFGDDFDTDLPREIGSTVVLRFRLQDLRNGEILVERPRFVYQTSYLPPVGETFTQGMTRALDGLAEQMVETMESDW